MNDKSELVCRPKYRDEPICNDHRALHQPVYHNDDAPQAVHTNRDDLPSKFDDQPHQ